MYYLTDPQTSWDVRRGLLRAVRLGVLERREVTRLNLMEGKWNGIFGIRGSVVEEMGLIYEVQQEENLHHEQWEELNQEQVEESEVPRPGWMKKGKKVMRRLFANRGPLGPAS